MSMVHGTSSPHKPARASPALTPAGGALRVQPPRTWTLPSLSAGPLWMLVVPLALLISVRPCPAANRPITVQVGGGPRIYNQELGLNSDLGADIRLGLGVSDRASVAFDFLYTPTNGTPRPTRSPLSPVSAHSRAWICCAGRSARTCSPGRVSDDEFQRRPRFRRRDGDGRPRHLALDSAGINSFRSRHRRLLFEPGPGTTTWKADSSTTALKPSRR